MPTTPTPHPAQSGMVATPAETDPCERELIALAAILVAKEEFIPIMVKGTMATPLYIVHHSLPVLSILSLPVLSIHSLQVLLIRSLPVHFNNLHKPHVVFSVVQ